MIAGWGSRGMRRYSELTKKSLCQGRSDDIYPDNGRPKAVVRTQLCPECPVRDLCLEHALTSPWQPYGTWGGLDQEEVRAMWMMRHPGVRERIEDIDDYLGVSARFVRDRDASGKWTRNDEAAS